MPGSAAQVDEPPFRQNDQRFAVRIDEFVDLRFDIHPTDIFAILEVRYFDLGIEMADIAHDHLVFHHVEVLVADHIAAAGCGHEDVPLRRASSIVVTWYPSIAACRASDRINFGNDHSRSESAHRVRTPLPTSP